MRPGDICARYGGEEFALVWSDTSLTQARALANTILTKVGKLNIPNKNSPVAQFLTASIGLAEMTPTKEQEEREIIKKADSLLYKAKKQGRNRLES